MNLNLNMDIVIAVVVGVIALLIGTGAGWGLCRALAPSAPVTPVLATGLPVGNQPWANPAPVPAPAYNPAPENIPGPQERSGLERQLVQALISLYDLAEASAARVQIVEDLARAGVNRAEAHAGAAFDPAFHKAVESTIATKPEDVDTVAGQIRPGWVGNDGVIRYVEVSLFTSPELVEQTVL